MANLYKTTPFVNGIELHEELDQQESFLILFPEQPDFDRFAYFVNYIEYPINQQGLAPAVVGYFYTQLAPNKAPHLVGEIVMVYVSNKGPEYDNVNIVTENNDSYCFDFGGKVYKLDDNENSFEIQVVDQSNYSHYIDIYPGPGPNVSGNKPWWKFW